MTLMHLSMSSLRRGGGVRHRGGILTFSKKNYQNPHPGQKIIVKISKKNGLLLLYSLKLTDQKHDVRSKSPPRGYASQSNSRGLPDPPLRLDIDKCITTCYKKETGVESPFSRTPVPSKFSPRNMNCPASKSNTRQTERLMFFSWYSIKARSIENPSANRQTIFEKCSFPSDQHRWPGFHALRTVTLFAPP